MPYFTRFVCDHELQSANWYNLLLILFVLSFQLALWITCSSFFSGGRKKSRCCNYEFCRLWPHLHSQVISSFSDLWYLVVCGCILPRSISSSPSGTIYLLSDSFFYSCIERNLVGSLILLVSSQLQFEILQVALERTRRVNCQELLVIVIIYNLHNFQLFDDTFWLFDTFDYLMLMSIIWWPLILTHL